MRKTGSFPFHAFRKFLTFCFVILLSCAVQGQNAIDLDGLDDRVIIPNASAYVTNGPISMAFWVYPTNSSPGWPDFDGFAGFRNDASADFFVLHLNSGTVEYRFRNSSGTAYTGNYSGVNLNAWNHFVMTYDGSTLRLFHNGSSASSVAASGYITSTTQPLNIGFLPFQSNPFYTDGRMDDVCLYNKALSPNEVSVLYNACAVPLSDPNLQLCYEFNQGTAGGTNTSITTAIDSKGNQSGTYLGFAMTGQTSNFIAYGKNTFATLSPSVQCSYTSPGGRVLDSTGTYIDTLTNSIGCDSIITINLTVTQPVDTLTVDACDSYTSPSGQVWNVSNTYADTLTSAQGCDSVLTIYLTVNYSDTDSFTVAACDSFVSPSGNQTWVASGNYLDTLQNAGGCDSILSIQLTISNPDTSVTVTGNMLTANAAGNVSYQWLLCDNGYQAIPSATNQSYTPGFNGNYAVVVTENGCADTSGCHYVLAVSSGDILGASRIQVFPNPGNGQFRIVGLPVGDGLIEIYDLNGRLVRAGTSVSDPEPEVNLLGEVPGIYFLKYTGDSGVATVKLLLK